MGNTFKESQADLAAYEDLVRLCFSGAVFVGRGQDVQWVVQYEGRVFRAGDAHPPWAMADSLVDRYPKTFVAARRHRDRLREVLGESGDVEEELDLEETG